MKLNQTTAEIRAQIAFRTADLTILRTRNVVALDQAAKREHRLMQMDIEGDLEDLGRALAVAQAQELSAASIARREAGRAKTKAVAHRSVQVEALHAEWLAKVEELVEIGEHISACYREISENAGFVQELDPIADPGDVRFIEERQDLIELSSGSSPSIACATAGAVLRIIDSLPCGPTVRRRYLVPEPIANWGESLQAVVTQVFNRLYDRLARKCQEPKGEVAA